MKATRDQIQVFVPPPPGWIWFGKILNWFVVWFADGWTDGFWLTFLWQMIVEGAAFCIVLRDTSESTICDSMQQKAIYNTTKQNTFKKKGREREVQQWDCVIPDICWNPAMENQQCWFSKVHSNDWNKQWKTPAINDELTMAKNNL